MSVVDVGRRGISGSGSSCNRRVLRPTPRHSLRNCDNVAQCYLRANVVCGDLEV